MSIHIDDKVKDLLLKFHSGEISPEEFKRLVDAVNDSGDKELYATLQEHWEGYDNYEPLPFEKKDMLYGKLQKNIRVSMLARMKSHWLQIAASLLLLVASSVTVMFYMQHQEIQQLTEQSVVISSGDYGPSSVLLPDGTKVRLNTKSQLSYQRDFGHKSRRVELLGEGYFEVKRDEGKQFIVGTGFLDVTVLGTTFNVYAYENKDFLEMSLVEGSVQVTTSRPPYQTIMVKPNEKVTYDKRTGELNLETTLNRIETAWLEKELVFRQDKLQDVFHCLERKFGVMFFVDNKILLQDAYTGAFDDENIESILRVLKLHYGFEYAINGTEISIECSDKMFNP